MLLAIPKGVLLHEPLKNNLRYLSLAGLPMITHPNFLFSSNSSTSMMESAGYKIFRKYNIDGVQLQLELVAKKLGFCLTQPICFYNLLDLLSKIKLVPIKDATRKIFLISNKSESSSLSSSISQTITELLSEKTHKL